MTENDKCLMKQADKLSVVDYWDGDDLKAKCDSEEAKAYIDRIMRRLYHLEEALNEME